MSSLNQVVRAETARLHVAMCENIFGAVSAREVLEG